MKSVKHVPIYHSLCIDCCTRFFFSFFNNKKEREKKFRLSWKIFHFHSTDKNYFIVKIFDIKFHQINGEKWILDWFWMMCGFNNCSLLHRACAHTHTHTFGWNALIISWEMYRAWSKYDSLRTHIFHFLPNESDVTVDSLSILNNVPIGYTDHVLGWLQVKIEMMWIY